MFQKECRTSLVRVPPKTQDRISKIRDLLGRAIVEVRGEIKRSPSRSPGLRRSEESSES